MSADANHQPIKRILVIMPTWLGDCVMATPCLRVLRDAYPDAQITALLRRSIRPALDACPYVDRLISQHQGESVLQLARRLRLRHFDLALLLPNSFRAALLARLGGAYHRIGYDRDGRGLLLTHRLAPPRKDGELVPVPTINYYLELTRSLGFPSDGITMHLGTRPQDDQRAADLLATVGVAVESENDAQADEMLTDGHESDMPGTSRPLIILNPGSAKAEKRWYPRRFAEVADRCVRELDAHVALTGAPNEREVLDAVHRHAACEIIDLPKLGVDLRLLKSVLKHAQILVTNDTGTRHVAAAMGSGVVTIFGPTDPAWTEISYDREEQIAMRILGSTAGSAPRDGEAGDVTETTTADGEDDAHPSLAVVDAEMVMHRILRLLKRVPAPRVGTVTV